MAFRSMGQGQLWGVAAAAELAFGHPRDVKGMWLMTARTCGTSGVEGVVRASLGVAR